MVAVVLIAVFGLVVYKLADLQVLNPTRYHDVGVQQRVRVQTLAADRGTIYDRNGTELAFSVARRSVFVDPGSVDPDSITESARQLAAVVGVDAITIEDAMRADNRFGYIARHVDDDVAAEVEALGLPGVGLIHEPTRVTPSGDLASSIVGLTDIDGNGLSGVEMQYADDLTGTPGRLVLEQNPSGRTISVGEHQLVPAQQGRDVHLTLDRSMQFETERILGAQVDAVGAKGGIAVVMKPDTGDILAMASMRTDPDTGEVEVDANNAAVTTSYEPGSVMKVVTAAGALENDLVTPDSVMGVPDSMQICDSTFTEHDFHGAVSWPVSKIIEQSSNTGTIKLAQLLGRDEVHRYLRAFGFGEPTAVSFPNEQSGQVAEPDDWWCSSMGTIPIGQGVSVTPLQMLMAYNTVANGGVYVAPRLVQSTTDADGVDHVVPVDQGRRVVSEQTADELNLVLRGVVKDGTGKKAAIDGYTVAGKTGTSRKPQPGGGYTDVNGVTQYMATFVGFVPAEAPTLSVIVIIDEPSREGIFGGTVAAPAWSRIAEAGLQRYSVPPPATDGPAARVEVATIEDVPDTPDGLSADGDPLPVVSADGRVRAVPAGEEAPASTTSAGSNASGATASSTGSAGATGTGTTGTGATGGRTSSSTATSPPTTAWRPPSSTTSSTRPPGSDGG